MDYQIEKAIKQNNLPVRLSFTTFCVLQIILNLIRLRFFLNDGSLDVDFKLMIPIAIISFIWPFLMQIVLKEKTSRIIGRNFEMSFFGAFIGQLISYCIWLFFYKDSMTLHMDWLVGFIIAIILFSLSNFAFLFFYLTSFGLLKLCNYIFKTS